MRLGESSKGRIKFSVRGAAVAAAAGFSALFAAPHGALAANGTWTGTTDFHWEVATNWLNNVVPGSNGGAAAGSYTLTLDGVNLSGTLTSNCQFVGSITDGAAMHLGVVKSGTGVWDLRATASAPNSYSGDTVINGGGIRCNGAGAMSPN